MSNIAWDRGGMENKKELKGKQRAKGREACRLRMQRGRGTNRVKILCLGTTGMEGNTWEKEWINLCPPEHSPPKPGTAGKTSWLPDCQSTPMKPAWKES